MVVGGRGTVLPVLALVLTFGLLSVRTKNLITLLGALALLSFALGEIILPDQPMFAYYMLPTRAGELFVGSICFFVTRTSFLSHSSNFTIEFTAWLGVTLIIASLMFLGESSGFPGFNAIPVTMGTACLIFSGSRGSTTPGRILSFRPMVAIGLISYSMYLWHWPVLAFIKYSYVELTEIQKVTSFFLILGLSTLSYLLIEKRFKADSGSFKTIFTRQLLIPSTSIIVICALIIGSKGFGLYYFDDEYRHDLAGFDTKEKAAPAYEYVCQAAYVAPTVLSDPNCIIGGLSEPEILFWGDSNASHYVGVIGELSEQFDFSFRNAAHHSCPPFLDDPQRFAGARNKKNCKRSNVEVLKVLQNYESIIISASWDHYVSKDKLKFEIALNHTIMTLSQSGKKVIVLGRVPRINSIDRKCAQKSLKIDVMDCGKSAIASRKALDRTNRLVEEITLAAGGRYYDVSEVLCNADFCSGILDNQFVYFDKGHLSMTGSIKIGTEVRKRQDASLIFSDLAYPRDEMRPPLPWSRYSNAAGKPDDGISKELLIENEAFFRIENWLGTKPVSTNNGKSLVFSDLTSSGYSSSVFPLDKGFDKQIVNLSHLVALKIEISIVREKQGFPMFRFMTSDPERRVDVIVDQNNASLILKGRSHRIRIQISKGERDLDITIELPGSFLSDRMSIGVYPAVTGNGKAYSKTNIGEVEVSQVNVFFMNQ